jgi:hypothetical protein
MSYAPRSKFLNIPTEVDGIRFDSRAEARRFGELRLLMRAGEISGLELQPKFELTVGGLKIADYFADFGYLNRLGVRITEDVKSKATRTPVYRIKKKLVKALYGVEIVEVA